MKQVKKLIRKGLYDPDKDNPFDLFISSTNIRYCYYRDSHKILGNTYGMLILQVRQRPRSGQEGRVAPWCLPRPADALPRRSCPTPGL